MLWFKGRKEVFGTAPPADRPESKEWWERQQRDISAITDDGELGLMSMMVTVSHNDSAPEMLAAIRAGPLAAATPDESIEYLLGRKEDKKKRHMPVHK